MKLVREATAILELSETSSGVNAMFVLNALYGQVDELTAAGVYGQTKADFAQRVRAELQAKFKKDTTFWTSFLGYFDPKNGKH